MLGWWQAPFVKPDEGLWKRLYKIAPTLHILAESYGTDPYTIYTDWSYEQYDFNRNVFIRAMDEQKKQQEKAKVKSATKKGRL